MENNRFATSYVLSLTEFVLNAGSVPLGTPKPEISLKVYVYSPTCELSTRMRLLSTTDEADFAEMDTSRQDAT